MRREPNAMRKEDVDVRYEWKELMAMRNEDRDVRYDSPWCRGHHFFPDGICWLCLRPFSDSDDEEQTRDTIGSWGIISTGPNVLYEICKSSLFRTAKRNDFRKMKV